MAIKQKLCWNFCIMFYLQVEVDWEKINAKIDMELQKEAARPGAKPYNGWHGFIYYMFIDWSAFWWCSAFENNLVNISVVVQGSIFCVEHLVHCGHSTVLTANTEK